MFLIGIVAGLRRIVLIIHAARLLRGPEIAGADAGGDHDLRFCRWINHRVVADLGRQEERSKLRAGRRHFLEPPDRELIAAGQGVHRNDRPCRRSAHALDEGIDVSCGIIVVSTGNVTGLGITVRRLDAVAHIYCHRQIPHAVGVGIVDRAHCWRTIQGAIAVGICHRWAAEFGFRLNVERHIPRRAVCEKFQQGPAGLVTGSAKVRQQPLALDADAHFGFGRIVLKDNLRQVGGVKLRAGGEAAAGVRYRDRFIGGERGRPELEVFAQVFGPLDRQVRRGGPGKDSRVLGIQPVDLNPVRVVIFALGVIDELAVGESGGPVERLATGLRAVERDRWNQIQVACRRSGLPRLELLAERNLDVERLGIAFGGHHIGAEELAVAGARDLRTEVFHKHAAFQIVGVQGRRADGIVKPQRAAFARE